MLVLSSAADRNFDPRINSLERKLPKEPSGHETLHGTPGEQRNRRGLSRWDLEPFVTRSVLSD